MKYEKEGDVSSVPSHFKKKKGGEGPAARGPVRESYPTRKGGKSALRRKVQKGEGEAGKSLIRSGSL